MTEERKTFSIIMASRIASGRMLEPEILLKNRTAGAHLPFPDEHLQVVRDGMDLVVNGAGTAVRTPCVRSTTCAAHNGRA